MLDDVRLRRQLQEREPKRLSLPDFCPAAVLVPLIRGAAGWELLFTVRPDHLPTHAGQISFPGGKRSKSDTDLVATAVRESVEELGVKAENLDVWGILDDVPTPTGFLIQPVVAEIVQPFELRPSEAEVKEVFTTPVSELAAPARYVDAGSRHFLGVDYTLHEYHYGQHRIWGATANMVHQLFTLAFL